MSNTTVSRKFKVENIYTDVTQDEAGEYEIYIRVSTYPDMTEVFGDQRMDRTSRGVYSYTWEDPSPNLHYVYTITYHWSDTIQEATGYVDGGQDEEGSTVATLLPKILPYLPGCTADVVLQYAAKMMQQFCEETYCWKQEFSFTTTSSTSPQTGDVIWEDEYQIERTGTFVVSILKTLDNGAISSIESFNPQTGMAKLNYVPNCQRSLVFTVALSPENSATVVPDFIYQRYGDCIASGVLFQLMSMKTVPWSNDAAANIHRVLWLRGQAQAKSFFLRDGTGAVPPLILPVF